MKRSDINQIIRDAEAFFEAHQIHLPAFARWSPADWEHHRDDAREVIDARLGWDVTDLGQGRFEQVGLVLFTVRNGVPGDPRYPKPYAEKVMVSRPGQVTPMHFHWRKTEDIINRGGGDLVVELIRSDADEQPTEEEVTVQVDGQSRRVPPRGKIVLRPGESITLVPRLYHAFWGDPAKGPVLIGEVSSVNDDATDNRFLEPLGRFPSVEEDEAPRRLLVSDYATRLER